MATFVCCFVSCRMDFLRIARATECIWSQHHHTSKLPFNHKCGKLDTEFVPFTDIYTVNAFELLSVTQTSTWNMYSPSGNRNWKSTPWCSTSTGAGSVANTSSSIATPLALAFLLTSSFCNAMRATDLRRRRRSDRSNSWAAFLSARDLPHFYAEVNISQSKWYAGEAIFWFKSKKSWKNPVQGPCSQRQREPRAPSLWGSRATNDNNMLHYLPFMERRVFLWPTHMRGSHRPPHSPVYPLTAEARNSPYQYWQVLRDKKLRKFIHSFVSPSCYFCEGHRGSS